MKFEKNNNIMSGSGEWDESEHPRDSEGKFTKKGLLDFPDKNSISEEHKKYFIEKIDKANKEKLKSKVLSYMERIVKEPVEHSITIDKNGNVFENIGKEDFVPDIGVDMNQGISLHNHTRDVSFSEDDFNFAKDKLGTEFLNVTPKYIHRLRVLKKIDKPYNYFYIRGLIIDDEENQQHNIMNYIKLEGYIEYERLERNSWVYANYIRAVW